LSQRPRPSGWLSEATARVCALLQSRFTEAPRRERVPERVHCAQERKAVAENLYIREARPLHERCEPSSLIAPEMTSTFIMSAPAMLPCRNTECEPAARFDLIAPLGQSSRVVFDMLEYLEGADDIELFADVRCSSSDDAATTEIRKPLSRPLRRFGIDLRADIVIVNRQPRPKTAQTGTYLEDRADRKGLKVTLDEVVAVPTAQSQGRQHSRMVVG